MIIVDLSQVMISSLMASIAHNKSNPVIEEDMIRHMILNTIRSIKVKLGKEYGEMVIACDSSGYWRKQLFPYYKANRKKAKENSNIDWNEVFECLNKIRYELKTYFPYRVIEVANAEADDIIGTLAQTFGNDLNSGEKIMIVSGDKDFVQLQKYGNVSQYDPVRKKEITHPDPHQFLKEHILSGDSGDGVPNFLSNDNCFVVGERQKPLTAKRMEHYLKLSPEEFGDERLVRNFHRNLQLIDLSFIPQEIMGNIMEEYEAQANKTRQHLFNYFIKHRLKMLMDSINEF